MRIGTDSTSFIPEKAVVIPQKNESKPETITKAKIDTTSSVMINTKTDNGLPKNSIFMSKENADKLSAVGVATTIGVTSGIISFCFRSGGPKALLLGAGLGAALGAGVATVINADSKVTQAIGLGAGAAPLFGTLVYAATKNPTTSIISGVVAGALMAGYVVPQANHK